MQKWLPIHSFFNDGLIYLKKGFFIKIIKIKPIHFELKSDFEKRSILKAYQTFLKNCNFDMQIVIQSHQENLSENIDALEKQKEKEISNNNIFMVNIFNQYIQFIQEKNQEKLSSSKHFYLIIMSHEFPENQIENARLELKEKYFKIKDALARCGNTVEEIKTKKEIKDTFYTFFNQKGSELLENKF